MSSLQEEVSALRAQNKNSSEIEQALMDKGYSSEEIKAVLGETPTIVSSPTPTPFTTLPSIGELFEQTWKTYTQKFLTLMGIYLLPSLLGTAIGALSLVYFGYGSKSSTPNPTDLLWIIVFFIAVLIVIYISLLSQVALVQALIGNENSIRDAYKQAKGKVSSFFWISLLFGLITTGGMILLIIPGIIFATWYSFSPYIFITEGLKGTSALQKSKAYVKGLTWQIFLRYLIVGLAIVGLYIVFGVLPALLGSEVVTTIARTIIQILLAPFLVCFSFILFTQVKTIKGDIVPEGGKTGIILAAIWGLIAIPVIIVLIIVSIVFALKKVDKNNPYSGFANTHDTKRAADIAGIQAGLEIHRLKNGEYPKTLSSLVPDFYKEVPKAPTPPDGKCSAAENEYQYTLVNKTTYTLTFCLGQPLGEYKAGLNTAKPIQFPGSPNTLENDSKSL